VAFVMIDDYDEQNNRDGGPEKNAEVTLGLRCCVCEARIVCHIISVHCAVRRAREDFLFWTRVPFNRTEIKYFYFLIFTTQPFYCNRIAGRRTSTAILYNNINLDNSADIAAARRNRSIVDNIKL